MKRALLIALVLAGCSKSTRVKQCDELLAVGEKIQNCETIPESSRGSIKTSMDSMRNALKMLEDVGDQAPKSQLEQLGQTCQRQLDKIREVYEKTAPECLK